MMVGFGKADGCLLWQEWERECNGGDEGSDEVKVRMKDWKKKKRKVLGETELDRRTCRVAGIGSADFWISGSSWDF